MDDKNATLSEFGNSCISGGLIIYSGGHHTGVDNFMAGAGR